MKLATLLVFFFLGISTCWSLCVPLQKHVDVVGGRNFHTRPLLLMLLEHRSKYQKELRGSLSKMLAPLIVAATVTLASNPAFAATNVFANDYADPFHPLCERHIEVSNDGTTFHYSGTAVGPKNDPVRRGCTPEEIEKFGLRNGAFDGIINIDGKMISVGDGIHEGVWEPANSASTTLGYEGIDGIRWNDGNKWIVLPKEKNLGSKIGEGIVFAYLGGSGLAGLIGIRLARESKSTRRTGLF
jgi:hypothetical protein